MVPRERWVVVTKGNSKEYLKGDEAYWPSAPRSWQAKFGTEVAEMVNADVSEKPKFAYDMMVRNVVDIVSWDCAICGKDTSEMNDCGPHRLIDVTPLYGSDTMLIDTNMVQWVCDECLSKVQACLVCGAGIDTQRDCQHCAACHENTSALKQCQENDLYYRTGWHDGDEDAEMEKA